MQGESREHWADITNISETHHLPSPKLSAGQELEPNKESELPEIKSCRGHFVKLLNLYSVINLMGLIDNRSHW